MVIMLIIIVCIVLGYLLARSRYSKNIDEAAVKVKGVFIKEPQAEDEPGPEQGDEPEATGKE